MSKLMWTNDILLNHVDDIQVKWVEWSMENIHNVKFLNPPLSITGDFFQIKSVVLNFWIHHYISLETIFRIRKEQEQWSNIFRKSNSQNSAKCMQDLVKTILHLVKEENLQLQSKHYCEIISLHSSFCKNTHLESEIKQYITARVTKENKERKAWIAANLHFIYKQWIPKD